MVLSTIKDMLQITDGSFDTELLVHINAAYFNTIQLGCPKIEITPNTIWSELVGFDDSVRSGLAAYLFLKVRIAFDPPTGSILSAFERQIGEYEFRITVQNESETT